MDTTSTNAQQSHKKQDFIAHEMEVTKEAIKTTAADIWQQVPTTEDVAAWTKANPLLAVGIAAGAGVLAGFMVTPSRGGKRQAHDRDGGGHSMLGSLVGAVAPALSMAVNEAGRTALSAAVAHFTSQQVAHENTAEGGAPGEAGDASGYSASTEAA